jgi:hypothetical protein
MRPDGAGSPHDQQTRCRQPTLPLGRVHLLRLKRVKTSRGRVVVTITHAGHDTRPDNDPRSHSVTTDVSGSHFDDEHRERSPDATPVLLNPGRGRLPAPAHSGELHRDQRRAGSGQPVARRRLAPAIGGGVEAEVPTIELGGTSWTSCDAAVRRPTDCSWQAERKPSDADRAPPNGRGTLQVPRSPIVRIRRDGRSSPS